MVTFNFTAEPDRPLSDAEVRAILARVIDGVTPGILVDALRASTLKPSEVAKVVAKAWPEQPPAVQAPHVVVYAAEIGNWIRGLEHLTAELAGAKWNVHGLCNLIQILRAHQSGNRNIDPAAFVMPLASPGPSPRGGESA